ncbi:hypothetical protein SCHPADRAFT_999174 [Schizopora paradoxa]|uniref:F-box domain-containing protein n=1 Tax=Schizopora paradoxa TaxID=27342 RepID=A0A0H2RNK5_9AGAM|nr:hypothetical protein SCHPADRAFT_999174 [Schizopora paradoxa]
MAPKPFPKLRASFGRFKRVFRRVRVIPCRKTPAIETENDDDVFTKKEGEALHAERVMVIAEDVAVQVGSGQRKEGTRRHTPSSKAFDLPFEVVLAVFMFLDIPELLRVSQVSRFFRDVANTQTIWHATLNTYLSECKTLVLDDFAHPSYLPLPELKIVLVRSEHLHRNWNRESPKQITSDLHPVKLDKHVPAVQAGGPYYIADQFMILPESNGTLACIDIKNDRLVGKCELSATAFPLLFSHTETASVFVVVTDYTSSMVKLTVRQAKFPSEYPQAGTSIPNMSFDLIREYDLSRRWGIITKIVDVDRRRICMLFLHPWPESDTMKLFVVLDWNDDSAVFLDSGLSYKSRHTGAVVRFSDDGEELTVFSEREDGIWRQNHYKVSELKKLSQSLSKGTDLPFHSLKPYDKATFRFADPFPSTGLGIYSDNVTMFQYWNSTYAQSWLKVAGLRSLFSYLYLMVGITSSNVKKFRVAQFYATETAPCHSKRFVFDLGNPVRVPFEGDELPLMSLSFNHLCWIDQLPKADLALKLVTFPDPFKRDDIKYDIRVLDAPINVLRNAAHVFMVPSLGSIMILTKAQHLYRFQYA